MRSRTDSGQIWSVGPDKAPSGEMEYLTLIKSFEGETPLNSAAIIPGKPYVRSSALSLRAKTDLADRFFAEVDRKRWR